MLRSSLICMIYEKTLLLVSIHAGDSKPVTLMSADIERIASGLLLMHESWACMLQVALALWLLWNQLGVAAIGPIIVAVCKSTTRLSLGGIG